MKRTLLVLAAGLLIAGCSDGSGDNASSATSSSTQTYPLSGLQEYQSVQSIVDDLSQGGLTCTGLALDDASTYAVQQGRCTASDAANTQLVLGIFSSEQMRSQGESGLKDGIELGFGYGYVAGGNWLINCGYQALCVEVKAVVGGRLAAEEDTA